jgi:Ca2+-binding RTX toxin-like protein
LSATKNLDKITDFKPGTDHIQLAVSPIDSPFRSLLNVGSLLDSEFLVGTAATTKQQHILYDPATGTLSYDSDGSGAHHAVAFAHITPGLVLHTSDFLVV